ncbi:MAG: hypothetical protein PHP02_03595 [Eubacteriales bacterium]|nr:hypothetical protein [Eubacteriales bacterium]
MKTLKCVFALSKRRFSRKTKPEEQLFCTETSCGSRKAHTGSLGQSNPARENCWNISNCKL